ncbi:helix-turn-helix transcriptional regulator [Actinacidiphila oryziradicis]|uniref:helix-turn-helix transcriptional regulator n=1 Tax=Actinacidiphila oryziradicis TaxID=2571141 RepID=UPI0023EFFB98|nr:helix-turn-helix transcriptional regulator [Actinacidiphila oryziradicis]MCW2875009.1 lpsR [Actinacidiphila oryziradicis]
MAAALAATLNARQLSGAEPLPSEPADWDPGLLREHRQRVRGLPDNTRYLLMLAAADQHPVPTHAFLRAVTAAGLDTGVLEPAEAAGIAHTATTGVVFRDPWTRIAAYETAPAENRREAHQLLARVLGGDWETPQRAWHRAAAALGPSRRLTAALTAGAAEARRGGRPAIARPLLQRAAELCPDPGARPGLLAQAAADAWRSGQSDRARHLITGARDGLLRGILALRGGDATDAFAELLRAADALAPAHPDRAVHVLARAAEAAIYTGDLRRVRQAAAVAARHGLEPPGTISGLAAAVEGRYDDARDALRTALGRCATGEDPTLLIHGGLAALLLGDDDQAASATVRAVAAARAQGNAVAVPQALEFRMYAEFWTGRPHAAEAAALDALQQSHETGQDNGACHLQAGLAMFAAITGDEATCRARAEAARAHALPRSVGLAAALSVWALAFLDLSTGRPEAAAARLRALAGFGPGHGHRAIRHLATPHYVEAAVRAGDTRVALAALADYEHWATVVRSPSDLALAARCRALLATGPDADEHYRTALGLHATSPRDFERARTELLYGSALRRLRRRAEARDRLHSALEAFTYFGAPHCAAQARAELRALGEPAPHGRTPPGIIRTLTAQQLAIARMAADGATNREIAASLVLSPRTIDHHLRGVFARLGIRSRIELVRLLATVTDPSV